MMIVMAECYDACITDAIYEVYIGELFELRFIFAVYF